MKLSDLLRGNSMLRTFVCFYADRTISNLVQFLQNLKYHHHKTTPKHVSNICRGWHKARYTGNVLW